MLACIPQWLQGIVQEGAREAAGADIHERAGALMVTLTLVPKCPYCQRNATITTGAVIYPARTELATASFWLCRPCNAWVGCHKGTRKPLGRLANANLRRAKMATHRAFDPLWKEGDWTRSQAYAWLAEKLGIATEVCHIGMFDLNDCERAIAACEKERQLA